MRPPEMKRSTIYHWIQQCSSCGYCSPNLSECSDNTKEIVNSKEYQNIIKNSEIPNMAASFLALSYENQHQHKYSDSAWRAIHAAWICDDENHREAAKHCRRKAISMIEKAHTRSQKIADQSGASEAITIDLMRRAGMFQAALELSENAKAKDIDKKIKQVIEYEVGLIIEKDIDSHTISDALGR
jgi:hypothetical protein